jgi:hypothetical protein
MVAGYTYTSLRDLGEFVKKDRNVYGIIVDGNSHPVKSKGSGTPTRAAASPTALYAWYVGSSPCGGNSLPSLVTSQRKGPPKPNPDS